MLLSSGTGKVDSIACVIFKLLHPRAMDLDSLCYVGQSKPTDDGFLTEDILNAVLSLLITPLISRVGDSTGTTGNVHFVFIFHPQAYPLTPKVSGVREHTILGCVSGCTHVLSVSAHVHICPSLFCYPRGGVSHVHIWPLA